MHRIASVPRSAGRCLFVSLSTLFVLLFCVLLNGQSQPEPQKGAKEEPIATFSSHTELVLVPVVVTDHHGEHVKGLKKEDFRLAEDGKESKIAVFEEVVANNAPVTKPTVSDKNGKTDKTAKKSIFTNDPGANSAKRLVILALDTINTPLTDQAYARKQMIKYLAQSVDPDSLVSLVMLTSGGVKVIHDFTTDTAVLMAALSKVTGKASYARQIPSTEVIDPTVLQTEVDELNSFADSANQAAVAGQRQMVIQWTYDNLNQIAQAYAGVPGRKSLIWVTAGFPFSLAGNNNQLTSIAGDGDVSDNLYSYEHMWQALSNANFAVYPVDARGLVNPVAMSAAIPSTTMSGGRVKSNAQLAPSGMIQQMRTHSANLDTFKDLAEMTGGEPFYNTNDLSKSFRQASNDAASYYVLGYYLNKDDKPGWHKLKAEVRRSGVQVRSRTGFLVATTADPERDRNTDVESALASPFDFTALPIQMRWTVQSHAPKDTTTTAWFDVALTPASLTVDESDNNHVKVEVIAIARRADGTVAGTVGQVVDLHASPDKLKILKRVGLIYSNNLSLPPAQYSVRFVVRDYLSGKVGSLAAPLTVE